MGLFTKNDSKEMLDKYLKRYINEDILFDGKKKDDEDEEEKDTKSKKGITLLTLVITIIVLLIITGITISATFSNNGVLNYSLEVRRDNAVNIVKEEVKAIVLDAGFNRGKFTPEKMNKTYEEVATTLKDKGVIESFVVSGTNVELTYKGASDKIILNPILDEVIQKNQLSENNVKNIFKGEIWQGIEKKTEFQE